MPKKLALMLVVILVLLSGCRFWQKEEPASLEHVPEADEHQFSQASYFLTPHKDKFVYTETKHLAAIELITLDDGTDRMAFSIFTDEEELAQFPSMEVLYDEEKLQLILNIYIGTQAFPVLYALDEAVVFSNYQLELLQAQGSHGLVNRYRQLTLELEGPVQYRLFWSESQRKLILDLQLREK